MRASILGLVLAIATTCTYAAEEQRAVIGQIVGVEDSYQALIVIQYERFREPTGLSAFPDGGKSRVLERRARLYLVDASERGASLLTEQAAPDSLWESFDVSVRALEADSIAYLGLTGCPRNGECHPVLQNELNLRVSRQGHVQAVGDVPSDARLPGVMLARRQGEEHYVRFSSDGNLVTARFEEDGPFEPIFEIRRDGSLIPVAGSGTSFDDHPARAAAQVCEVPDSIRLGLPDRSPAPGAYQTLGSGGAAFGEIQLGVGHLHYSSQNPVVELPPGEDDWLRRVELPLSQTPGTEPTMWIAGGWVVGPGSSVEPLTTRGLVETGYEESSFVVLESRADGWLRIRYATAEGDAGSAWTPSCALASSEAKLDFTRWSEWFLGDRVSPMFFRSEAPGALRSEPSLTSAASPEIAEDYALEPLEIRGEWMRVTVKEPSDYCRFELTPTAREGWVRWYAPDRGPLLWYFTRGC